MRTPHTQKTTIKSKSRQPMARSRTVSLPRPAPFAQLHIHKLFAFFCQCVLITAHRNTKKTHIPVQLTYKLFEYEKKHFNLINVE